MNDKKSFQCKNCGYIHQSKEWIQPCTKCGKEICEACEMTIFTEWYGSTECFDCRDKENQGEECPSCNGEKYIQCNDHWCDSTYEVKCPKCNYRCTPYWQTLQNKKENENG